MTQYGYARGGEALHFAENIRNYYDILLRLESEYDPMINLGSSEDARPRRADPATPQRQAQSCGGRAAATPPIHGRSASGTVTLPSAFW